ncbi:hypothetical protein [Pseudomonas promysalinigenes]|uniref:hypothetical protein n=1 Tax=Pseudomonas promysalinigenes TaxID=485898 RepID=UPI003F9F4FDF
MKPIITLQSLAQRGYRALLVIALEQGSTLLIKAGVRLYARGYLGGIEVRLLLGFASDLRHRSQSLL